MLRVKEAGSNYIITEGDPEAPIILLCEHASNALPEGVDLGVEPHWLRSHYGYDPGAEDVMLEAARVLGIGSVRTTTSRLFCDVNRILSDVEIFRPELDPGVPVPGNRDMSRRERAQRIQNYYDPFHEAVKREIQGHLEGHPHITLISVHSFDPGHGGSERRMDIGLVFDGFDGLIRGVQAGFERRGYSVALNEPYSGASGKAYAMHIHGMRHDLVYWAIEVNNRLIGQRDEAIRIGHDLGRIILEL